MHCDSVHDIASCLSGILSHASRSVVILAVTGQQPVHDAPDVVAFPLDQQVNVIRHQAIGI